MLTKKIHEVQPEMAFTCITLSKLKHWSVLHVGETGFTDPGKQKSGKSINLQ